MFVHVIDSDEFIERLSDADAATKFETVFHSRATTYLDTEDGTLSVRLTV